MKVTALLVLSGSCLSLLFTGCQKHDMLSKRGYIQAPDGNYYQHTGPEQSLEIDGVEQSTPGPEVSSEPVKATIIKPPVKQPQYHYQPETRVVRPPIAAPEKYIVKKGDYLGKIGRQYGVGAAKLAAYNKIDIKKPIQIGQTILIPPPGTAVQIDEATRRAATKPVKSTKTSSKTDNRDKNLSGGHYVVKRGDSIYRIAARYKVKRADLMAANNIDENSILRIGQKLVIPGKTTTRTPAPGKTPSASASTAPAPVPVPAPADKTPVPENVVPDGQSGTTDDILAGVKDPVSNASFSATETPSPAVKPVTSDALDDSRDATADLQRRSSIEVTTDTTLAQIASQYGVDLEELKKANSDIKEGQTIRSGRLIFLPEQ